DPQPPGPDHLAEQLLEAGLEEPGPALADEVELAGVVVVDHHVMADMGQTGGGDEADVAGADHGDAHADELLGAEWNGRGPILVDLGRSVTEAASLSGSSPSATLRRHAPHSVAPDLALAPAA